MTALSASSNAEPPMLTAFRASYDHAAPAVERAIGEAARALVGVGSGTVVLFPRSD